VEALREELELMRAADPGAKAIVFSQFTSMLELIGFRLEQVRTCGNKFNSAVVHGVLCG
jgi:hypothetical protein